MTRSLAVRTELRATQKLHSGTPIVTRMPDLRLGGGKQPMMMVEHSREISTLRGSGKGMAREVL